MLIFYCRRLRNLNCFSPTNLYIYIVVYIYYSLVRLILECDSRQLENVQLKFLSFVAYLLKIECPLHDYSSISKQWGPGFLVDRRHTDSIKFMWNLLSDYIQPHAIHGIVNSKASPNRNQFTSFIDCFMLLIITAMIGNCCVRCMIPLHSSCAQITRATAPPQIYGIHFIINYYKLINTN